MGKYMTKQRKAMLDFLSQHTDEAMSAKQIALICGEGKISVSAVYRNLSALEQDGIIKRISKAGSRESFFQYTAAPKCRDCLHLSCKCCGKTYHMNTAGTELLTRSLAENDGFSIDKSETILYGICTNCKNA